MRIIPARWPCILLLLCSQIPLPATPTRTEIEKLDLELNIVSASQDLALVWDSDSEEYSLYRYGAGAFINEASLGSFPSLSKAVISNETVVIQSEQTTLVLARVNGVWETQATLPGGDYSGGDYWRTEIALDGDTLCSGSLVYRRTNGVWELEADLLPNNWEEGDGFPHGIGLSGNTIVIGAGYEAGSVPGINASDGMDNDAVGSGAVYIFEKVDGVWIQTHYIKAQVVQPAIQGIGYRIGFFGTKVKLLGDTLFVTDGSTSPKSAVYERKNGEWEFERLMRYEIISLLREDLAVIGRDYEASSRRGIRRDLYSRSDDGWQLRRNLKMSDQGTWLRGGYTPYIGSRTPDTNKYPWLSSPYLMGGKIVTAGWPGAHSPDESTQVSLPSGMYVFSADLGEGIWLESAFPDSSTWNGRFYSFGPFREKLAATRNIELVDFDNGWYWGTDGHWLLITGWDDLDDSTGYVYVAAEETWYYVETGYNNFETENEGTLGMHYYNFTTGSWEFRSYDGVLSD